MEIVVLDHEEVERLLPMKVCIDLMADALAAASSGEVHNPLRFLVRPPEEPHFLGLMPAFRGGARSAYALKEVCVVPDNPRRGLDSHQGAVLLHSAETGELLGVMNASAITAIRTAAVSGVATRLLAREDAGTLALVGTGVQARSHLEAMSLVRDLRSVRIAGRGPENARAFVAREKDRYAFSLEAAGSVEEAVHGADVVVTVTSSSEPVLQREWLAAGTHVNAVGSSIPTARELDTRTVAESTLFVDRRESTLNESGDYLAAAREGAVGPEHIRAELGEVVLGRAPGRSSREELTLFKSLGIAVEDLAAAQHLYDEARRTGVGSWVSF